MSEFRGVTEAPLRKPGRKTRWSGITDVDSHADDEHTIDESTGFVIVPNDDEAGAIGGRKVLFPATKSELYSGEVGADSKPMSTTDIAEVTKYGVKEPEVELPPPTPAKGKKGKGKAVDAASIKVAVTGPWGRMTTTCSHVVREGVALGLIGCSWEPPATDDKLKIEWAGKTLDVYSPGVSLPLPGLGRMILLFVEEGS